jgi:hypothetical protein
MVLAGDVVDVLGVLRRTAPHACIKKQKHGEWPQGLLPMASRISNHKSKPPFGLMSYTKQPKR